MEENQKFLISDLLSPATIELNLNQTERDELLQALVSKIPDLKNRPEAQETLLRAIIERESLHSTGIGDGIALPHARNALVGLVEHPVIVFGRHKDGIPYGAIDGEPAKLFFLIVAPNVTQHLHILARISRILRQPGITKSLLSANTPEKVISIIKETEERLG
ncbi:MAG: PTS sugar transporter subunit IIA [Verrucomicrobiia bacterium]|jgi:mannitol/fructose-specific phosphotransferase system IIA component (Ntr-type)